MKWAGSLWIAGVLACSASEALNLPSSDGAAHLLVVQTEGTFRVWAYEDQVPPTFAARDVEAYFLLSYDEPLATLGFEPGEQRLDPSGRVLPAWSELRRRSADGGDWVEGDGAELSALRFATKSDRECQLPNECWVRQDGVGWCRRDCPSPPTVESPAAPEATVLPDLGPCAIGWGEVLTPFVDRSLRTCEPLDLGCNAEQERWLGDESCTSRTCPDWPAETADLYVDPQAAADGDGSQGRPFTRLADALAVAGPGATIALSAGEHQASGLSLAQVNLHGACAARVRLRLPAGEALALSSSTSLTGLTVSPRLVVTAGAHRLERVDIEADEGTGVRLQSGTLVARRVAIRGARVGLQQLQGQVELDQVAIDASWLGMKFDGEAAVRRARVEVPSDGHAALEATDHLTLSDSWLRGGAGGVRLRAATSTIHRSLVDGAREGLQTYGGSLVLTQTQVRRSRSGGLIIRDIGNDDVNYGRPRARITDVYSRDSGGAGLAAVRGDFLVARAAVHRATELGVLIGGAEAALEDVSVWQTSPRASGANAGLAVGLSLAGGRLAVTRVWLEDHAAYAFNAYAYPPAVYDLKVTDLLIRGVTRRAESGSLVTRGHGVILSPVGAAELNRARVVRTAEAALRVESDTEVRVSDLESEACGYGVELLIAPALDATRVAIIDPDVGGLAAGGSAGSHFELRHLSIRDRREPPSASRGLWLLPVFEPGSALIEDFRIEGLLGEGLINEGDWSLDLRRGAFIDNEVGLAYPAAGPLPDEADVIYRNNRAAVQAR